MFIHYLTATANDVCKESKRQTISADDVITALEDLEFGELVPALREALEGEKGLQICRMAALSPWHGGRFIDSVVMWLCKAMEG